jgi:hypothetical protein
MSVVILGGNDCMVRRYKDICKDCSCHGKVFTHMERDLRRRIGSPDLIVLFTAAASHQLAASASEGAKQCGAALEFCHTSSANALQNILQQYSA